LETIITKSDLKNIELYLEELYFHHQPKEIDFVHTDLQGKNILYDEKKLTLTGILDFSDAKIGSISLDFCHFLDIDIHLTKEIITQYRGYYDDLLFQEAVFLHKRSVLFEVQNDEYFYANTQNILQKLKKYEFIT
jgi:aminoglycoside phosphotransferase (APT) family kinase protein